MKPNPLQINGLFLSFTEEEISAIYEALESQGYAADAKGLKEWILEAIQEPEDPDTPTDRVLGRLGQYLIENPQSVEMAANYANRFAKSIMKGIKRKGAAR